MRSEDELGVKWDRCLADTGIKLLGGDCDMIVMMILVILGILGILRIVMRILLMNLVIVMVTLESKAWTSWQ